jgi:hypothetical protein
MKQPLRVFVFASLLALSLSANAQEAAFGLKAGLNLSSLNIDDPEASYETRTGYHAGIFVRARGGSLGFQPELLLFTQRGEGQSAFGNFTESFTYLSIPVMFKFYPVAGLNLQAGPQFGFLLDGEQEYSNGIFSGKRDITDSYKSSDASLSLGGGYDFDFGLSLDVRYNLGLKDINNLADGEETKSKVFMVSLGWNFLK